MTTKRWTAWAAAAVVFCCAAGSLSAKGPIVFGVRAGLQTQGLNPSTGADLGIANADKDFGYQLGFLARFNLPILYIQPELMYTSHRFTMNLEGDASAKVSMKNLELPVMVGMKIAFLRVMAGPVFNLMNDTKNKLKKTSMAVTADITRPLVSYQLGAGIELGHIGFDVRYGGQFKRADMTVVKGENLFPRLDMDKALEELEAAEAAAKKAALPAVEVEPQLTEKVDFDTFCKSDFRAVKVKACDAVKKSEKLLRFTLDDGTGVDRQILSGIHKWYEPEDLVGKTLIAIVNLPPRKMMGLESNGMLISAVHTEHGEECLHLIMVDDSIPAGAKLC